MARNGDLRNREDMLIFSFKYLDLSDTDFCIDRCDLNYYKLLLDRIKQLSKRTVFSFQTKYEKSLRNHSIKWEDINKNSFGFPNEEQIVDKPWQFSVTSNEHGRVIGFFIGYIFYIVWLDCNHNLYD